MKATLGKNRWAAFTLLLFTSPLCWGQKPELVVQTGHPSGVMSVAFSPDGKILASGSFDNTVKLWDVSTGTELRTLKVHSNGVVSVAFSPEQRADTQVRPYKMKKII